MFIYIPRIEIIAMTLSMLMSKDKVTNKYQNVQKSDRCCHRLYEIKQYSIFGIIINFAVQYCSEYRIDDDEV